MSHHTSQALQRIKRLCNQHLNSFVQVQSYEYTSCYLWHDRPLYNDFGEQIRLLKGDTIYLYEKSTSLNTDLFHELGHLVGRKCNLVGHKENGYLGRWQQTNKKLIAQVSEQRHWSSYLNSFAGSRADFKANAASELWAELFMLWHLYPTRPESRLIEHEMQAHANTPVCIAITQLAGILRIQAQSN